MATPRMKSLIEQNAVAGLDRCGRGSWLDEDDGRSGLFSRIVGFEAFEEC